MSEIIASTYQIIRRIRRDGDAVVYTAKIYAGESAGYLCVLKRYEPEIPADAEPAYTNGLNRFLKDCTQLAQTNTGNGCTVRIGQFLRVDKTVVAVSSPFSGVPIKEFWRGAAASPAEKLHMLTPVLKTVAEMNGAGVQLTALDAENIYVANGVVTIADFGTCGPFEKWRQVYMLGCFLQNAGIDASVLPHAQVAVLRRALFTDPATRYADSATFVRELLLPAAPPLAAVPLPAGEPISFNITGVRPTSQGAKPFAAALVVILVVFIVLGALTAGIVYFTMGRQDIHEGILNTIRENVAEPAATADELYDDYEYDYDEDYEYEDKRDTVVDTYVRYDFWDDYSLFDGIVAEYGDTLFYRIRQKHDVVLMSENKNTSEQKAILFNYLPAFVTITPKAIYFIDCLDSFRLYSMNHDGTNATLLTEEAVVFLTLDTLHNTLLYTDLGTGAVTAMHLDTGETEVVLDIQADCLIYNEESGLLYFVDASLDDEICTLDINTGETTPLGVYGYDLQLADGILYYVSNNNFLYRYNPDDQSHDRLLREDIYAYTVMGNSLFYVDGNREYNIYRAGLDGRNAYCVVKDDVDMIWNAGGLLYYVSYEEDGAMKRCAPDGSGVTLLDK